MQDAGLPHAGCLCARCLAAHDGDRSELYATSLAVVDARRHPAGVWLIDATPDIKYQLHLLAPWLSSAADRPGQLRQPDGIILTHAHMGHTGGLPALGPEAMNVNDLPVYAAPPLLQLLETMDLWRPLMVKLQPVPLRANQTAALARDLTLLPVAVPHRDELGAGTFGFILRGPSCSLLYLPDIDGWEQWAEARQVLSDVDVAVVDATFYRRDEIGRQAAVAHPTVLETLDFFEGWPGRLVLTHFNHTNPLLDANSQERKVVGAAGVEIGSTGQRIPL